MTEFTRRSFVASTAAAASLALAGCQSSGSRTVNMPSASLQPQLPPAAPYDPEFAAMYGPIYGEPFEVPAVDPYHLDPAFRRQLVAYPSAEAAGTIVVDPYGHYLYSVRGDGTAIRYGVGVGRQGFSWTGDATIQNKQEWPDWYPPKEMQERQPEIVPKLTQLQGGLGMAGGPSNPLGARALYLYQGNKDTLYRIHGTFEPWTIGQSVSSGCIRMINQDAIDLYGRTPMGTRVVVLGAGEGLA